MISLAVSKTGVYRKYHANRSKYQEPVCRALWTVPFKAVPVHPLIVAMRLVETLVTAVSLAADSTLAPVQRFAKVPYAPGNKFSSLAQGVPTAVGAMTPEEAKAHRLAIAERQRQAWAAHLESLDPVARVRAEQGRLDKVNMKNIRRRERLSELSPAERAVVLEKRRANVSSGPARATLDEEEVERLRLVDRIYDQRMRDKRAFEMLAMDGAARQEQADERTAEMSRQYERERALAMERVAALSGSEAEAEKERQRAARRAKKVKSNKKRADAESVFVEVARLARRRVVARVDDAGGSRETHRSVFLQVEALLLRSGIDVSPLGDCKKRHTAIDAACKWAAQLVKKTPKPGVILPEVVADYVRHVSGALKLDISRADWNAVVSYNPGPDRPLWFDTVKGCSVRQGWGTRAPELEGDWSGRPLPSGPTPSRPHSGRFLVSPRPTWRICACVGELLVPGPFTSRNLFFPARPRPHRLERLVYRRQ